MDIVLIGEFSGLHLNLKEGLQQLGINVLLVANGDGWKNFESDFCWYDENSSRINKYFTLIKNINKGHY